MRIPAEFCGIFGFKPTSQRIPFLGLKGILPNDYSVLTSPGGKLNTTLGPFCRSMRDMVSFMKLVFHPEVNNKYDIFTPPFTFRQEPFERAASGKIRVGVLTSLPTSPASEPVQRAVNQAVSALKK